MHLALTIESCALLDLFTLFLYGSGDIGGSLRSTSWRGHLRQPVHANAVGQMLEGKATSAEK
eukprot:4664215-Amphidinium_carterae.1